MKLKISVIVAALAMVMGWAAAAWADGLNVSQQRLEFGNMKEGVKAEKVVILTNTGTAPLRIANVKTS